MKNKRFWIFLIILAIGAMACQLGSAPILTAAPATPVFEAPTSDMGSQPSESNLPGESQDLLVNLYERVMPGVVSIQVISGTNIGSQGSGFVINDQGYIVTNYHVVEGAKEVEVDFTTGFKTYGTVIGTDLDSDLAVVKVNAPAEEINPVSLGDSDSVQVGQTVIAIGNPFGLSGSMTTGIISALGRTLDSERDAPSGGFFTAGDIIQTDAAINPGNSGGPLFNLQGEVIGVNRAIRTTNFTQDGQPINSGIGFAVSINIVKRVAPVLIESGKYDYPYIGISSVDELSLPQIEALGLKRFTGAYVTSVTEGGPAEQAGIHAGNETTSIPNLMAGGDLIIALDGHSIQNFDDLIKYLINNKSPNDTVVMTVLRGEEQIDITVTLGKRP